MANIKSAIKRARQNVKIRQHNASYRSMFRTFIKNVLKAVDSGDQEAAKSAFLIAQEIIDKASSKKLIHKNKASRIKSRLNARVKAMSSK